MFLITSMTSAQQKVRFSRKMPPFLFLIKKNSPISLSLFYAIQWKKPHRNRSTISRVIKGQTYKQKIGKVCVLLDRFISSSKGNCLLSLYIILQSFIKIGRELFELIDIKTHRQTDRHTDRQTHRQTHTLGSIATYSVKMTEYKNETRENGL